MTRAFVPGAVLVLLFGVLGLTLAGCSHKPKPRAVIPEAHAATRPTDRGDSTATAVADSGAADSTAGNAAPPTPRRTTRTGSTDRGQGVQTGASSSAAPGPAASGGATAADTLRAKNEPLAPILPEGAEVTLQRETRKAVDEARTRLAKVDEKKLDEEKRKKLKIASDFVAEAERALERKEYERAAGLATKARLLAEELSGG